MQKKILYPLAALALVAVACRSSTSSESQKKEAPQAAAEAPVEINKAILAAFSPLPYEIVDASNELNEDKINLGRQLYYDERLSKNHDVSCNTCHLLDQYGVDNKALSPGHRGLLGDRNSPSVYNAATHFVQFWDGRASTVEEQALGPIENPVEMAASRDVVLATLRSIPEYVEAFQKSFPGEEEPLTFENVGRAIGAFERRLQTPSRWDRFLQGDENALTNAEKEGFNTFVANGCITCHAGPALGGQMFQKVGLVNPWPSDKDQGRFQATQNEADRMVFKAMSLRNVLKTAPYFHDGSVEKIEDAIQMMGHHQLGREISDEDTQKIVTFLGALTGEFPMEYIARPELPPSTEHTPKPDPS